MTALRTSILLAGTLATLGCGDSTDPGDHPIAFVFAYAPANDVTQIDLYVMSENGRVKGPLVRREGMESHPAWSPDGTRIAFASEEPLAGDAKLYTVRADGSGLTQLTTGATEGRGPAWSPDGSRIAFVQLDASSATLAIMNSDGSGVTPVPGTQGIYNHAPPSWSPDGTRLAFGRLISTAYAIWTVGPDGSGLTRLTSGACGDFDPSWSPDGTKLAFVACTGDGGGGIFIVDADGSNQRQLTVEPTDRSPSWSPDGRRIVFEGRRDGAIDLYIVNVADGEVLNLTRTPSPEFEMEPDWRPAP